MMTTETAAVALAVPLTAARARELPRVNLLPPEIGERQQLRKLQTMLGAGVAASVALVAVMQVAASGDVGAAEDELGHEQASGQQLLAAQAEFAAVPGEYAKVDLARAQLRAAMGSEVRWSYLLDGISRRVPATVWLTQATFTQNDSAAASGASGAPVPSGIGTVELTGSATSHDDVADWLDSLGTQDGFTDPYFTSSTEGKDISGRKIVTFTSTVTLDANALSGRFSSTED